MIFKKKEFFLLIFLVLLQSCSGGRIGNFLESSFNDFEIISKDEDLQENLEIISKDEDLQENLENQKVVSQENKEINDKNNEKIQKVEKTKIVLEDKEKPNLEKNKKKEINKTKNSSKDGRVELESYKIIFILKDVDPKDPTEELSNILSDSEVNFEIEKIERIINKK